MPKRKCKNCKKGHDPAQMIRVGMSLVCGESCRDSVSLEIFEKAIKKQASKQNEERKAFRRETARRKEAIKGKRDYTKDAQVLHNRWVRLRDEGKPCISCERTPNDDDLAKGSRIDCGHYRTVGANPELRFEPLNTHAQCVYCNRNLSGNVTNYRIGLLKRIGQEKLDWLEGPHDAKRYTIEDLKTLIADYRQKIKAIST